MLHFIVKPYNSQNVAFDLLLSSISEISRESYKNLVKVVHPLSGLDRDLEKEKNREKNDSLRKKKYIHDI